MRREAVVRDCSLRFLELSSASIGRLFGHAIWAFRVRARPMRALGLLVMVRWTWLRCRDPRSVVSLALQQLSMPPRWRVSL